MSLKSDTALVQYQMGQLVACSAICSNANTRMTILPGTKARAFFSPSGSLFLKFFEARFFFYLILVSLFASRKTGANLAKLARERRLPRFAYKPKLARSALSYVSHASLELTRFAQNLHWHELVRLASLVSCLWETLLKKNTTYVISFH